MITDNETLGEAKSWLREQVRKGGADCPCCTQFAKVYKRRINAGMARSLIQMHNRSGLNFVHVPTFFARLGGDFGKLAYWGLVEEANEPREDGGRAGYWRVTTKGEDFITKGLRVPKYAKVYDGRCLGLECTEMVSIRDCLGKKFDLTELMSS